MAASNNERNTAKFHVALAGMACFRQLKPWRSPKPDCFNTLVALRLRLMMRSKLFVSGLMLVLCTCYLSADPVKSFDLMVKASNEAAIKDWAANRGTSSRLLKYKEHGKSVIVVLVDTASGSIRENIYVYFLEGSDWHLCLLRTSNGAVEVENNGKSLIFRNNKGQLLVEQPFDSMVNKSE